MKGNGLKIGVLSILAVTLVGLIVTIIISVNMKKDYEAEIEGLNITVNDLQSKVDELGMTETCFQLAYDVKAGTIAKETDLIPVDVALSASGEYIHDIYEIIGKSYKLNYSAADKISADMLYTEETAVQDRYMDVVCDMLPIGIEAGDYVDIRVTFALGQDFVALTNKRVEAIYGNTIKIIGDNLDIYAYNSMILDKGWYQENTVSIYASEYIEPIAQGAASDYYPLRLETLSILVQDPNVTQDLKKFTAVDRSYLEGQLVDYWSDSGLATARASVKAEIANGKSVYDAYIEEQAKIQAELDQQAAEQAAMNPEPVTTDVPAE